MPKDTAPSPPASSYKSILLLAAPIILANATEPLLGLVDTAVIGHSAQEADLGGMALGAVIFSFIYWGFGFLRMGTTGFVAQSWGAGDAEGLRASLGRALLLAWGLGLLILALHPALRWAAFALLDGSAAVHAAAQAYFSVRVWSTPATLTNFVIFGALIGLGKSRVLLALQLLLNGLNVALDVLFVLHFNMGVAGVAWGTVLAHYAAMAVGLTLLYRQLRPQGAAPLWPWQRIMQRSAWRQTLSTNSNIMWRTLFLLGGFAWFTNQSAVYGDDVLAANHILLQCLYFSAFFLDGFAFVVEALVGRSLGAGRLDVLRTTLWRSTVLAGGTAALLALALWAGGPWLLRLLAPMDGVVAVGVAHLPFAALYIALSFAAFVLDGVFIGASRGAEMRNSAIAATALFVLLSLWWMPLWGTAGLWLAFIVFVLVRALCLGAYLPRLLREPPAQPL